MDRERVIVIVEDQPEIPTSTLINCNITKTKILQILKLIVILIVIAFTVVLMFKILSTKASIDTAVEGTTPNPDENSIRTTTAASPSHSVPIETTTQQIVSFPCVKLNTHAFCE